MHQSPQHTFGVPSDNWASGHQKKRDGTVWLPAMLVGALIFALGCGSGLLVGWFAGTVNSFGKFGYEPASVTIQDIDFAGSACDNMRFTAITPTPNAVDTNPGSREQSFNRALGANQSTEFVFEIIPNQAGTYNNEITVYMDDYNSEFTTVTIEDQPEE